MISGRIAKYVMENEAREGVPPMSIAPMVAGIELGIYLVQRYPDFAAAIARGAEGDMGKGRLADRAAMADRLVAKVDW